MFSLLLHFEVLPNRVSFDDPFGFHVDISIFRIRLKIASEDTTHVKSEFQKKRNRLGSTVGKRSLVKMVSILPIGFV